MPLQSVKIANPGDLNLIMGLCKETYKPDVIRSVLIETNPKLKFGLTYNEGSGTVCSGTDETLQSLAKTNAEKLGVTRLFVLMVDDRLPVEVLKSIKSVQAISDIYCATSQSIEIILMEGSGGKRVVGVVDELKTPRNGISRASDSKQLSN